MLNTTKTIGAILAGGKSTRMGKDKAMLELDSQNMLERTQNIIAGTSVDHVVVNRNDEKGQFLPDIMPNKGPLSGIHSIVSAFPDCNILIVPVDLPLLDTQTLQLLIDAGKQHQSNAVFCRHVLPLYIHNHENMAAHLTKILQKEANLSIRHFCSAYAMTELALSTKQSLFNANTPKEWLEALGIHKVKNTSK